MATVILKNSSVAAKIPLVGDLALGELAVNTTDGIIYMKNGAGSIIEVGNGIADVVSDTTPQLGGMLDVNGFGLGDGTLELLSFTEVGSAVNEFTIANAATGNGPTLSATGGDANIDININPKGTGDISLTGNVGLSNNTFENWSSDQVVLQLSTNSSLMAQVVGTAPARPLYILHNAYLDGITWKPQDTGGASAYRMLTGEHLFRVAPSGTADVGFSWLDALTIKDSSGMYTNGAAGGDQGSGTINATGLYVNGAAVFSSQWTTTGSDIYYNTGDVGIGISAFEAWQTTRSVLQVGGTASISASTSAAVNNVFDLTQNAYHNGTAWTYQITDEASLYNQTVGKHYFYVAPSGPTGTPIAFVKALAIENSSGIYTNGATGGDQGSGTFNATGLYVNGVAVSAGGLANIVEDTTPQLGGNLDVQASIINTSTVDGSITLTPNGTGNVVLGTTSLDGDQTLGAGQDNYVLTYDNATGLAQFEASTGSGLANIVEDTTPQLGAMLDVNGFGFGDGTLELLSFTETALAVNEFTIANAATSNGPTLSSTGTDTTIDINITPKGGGQLNLTAGVVNIEGSTSTRFNIIGTSGNSDIRFTNTATGSTATDGLNIGINSGGGGVIWAYENGLTFGSNNIGALRFDTTNHMLIGDTTRTDNDGFVHIKQNSATAAIPVLTLEQSDVSEELLKVIGTSTTDASQSLVDAANLTTPGTLSGWIKIEVQDDQTTNPIADGTYYIPFYTAPTA